MRSSAKVSYVRPPISTQIKRVKWDVAADNAEVEAEAACPQPR